MVYLSSSPSGLWGPPGEGPISFTPAPQDYYQNLALNMHQEMLADPNHIAETKEDNPAPRLWVSFTPIGVCSVELLL